MKTKPHPLSRVSGRGDSGHHRCRRMAGGSYEILRRTIGGIFMRKFLICILAAALLLSCGSWAYAAETDKTFFFELSADGTDTRQVKPGDIITVAFYLQRTDSGEPYDMCAMQNEIRYDSNFFRLVEGSELLSDGIQTTDLGLRDTYREFYMNYLSLSGGTQWPARRLIGSFQLEVIAESGVTQITNQDYLVSSADGRTRYPADCRDVTVIVSTECIVTFESNGGTKVPDRTVRYGEKLERPEDPIRDGYDLEGWYRDIDLQEAWDFETDTVQGNMTLYAKWAQGHPGGAYLWLWWLVAAVLLLLILLLLLGYRTVTFIAGTQVRKKRVRRGRTLQRPEDPVEAGKVFAGWYRDEARTDLWDFETDQVEKNMTLYAGWL